MTLDGLARVVADDFIETMNQDGFDTFSEMRRCYKWDSDDIKDEVDWIITNKTGDAGWMSDDRRDVYDENGDFITYNAFMRKVYAMINENEEE